MVREIPSAEHGSVGENPIELREVEGVGKKFSYEGMVYLVRSEAEKAYHRPIRVNSDGSWEDLPGETGWLVGGAGNEDENATFELAIHEDGTLVGYGGLYFSGDADVRKGEYAQSGLPPEVIGMIEESIANGEGK